MLTVFAALAGAVSAQADLTVSPALLSSTQLSSGVQYSVQTTITNAGNAAATGVRLGVYLSTDATITATDTLLVDVGIGTLSAGGIAIAVSTFQLPILGSSGTRWIGVFVDPFGQVAESNENNNTAAAAAQYTAPPDLTVTQWQPPASLSPRQWFSVPLGVQNAGPEPSAAIRTGIYLSTDLQITTADRLLREIVTPALAAGATNSTTVHVLAPSDLPAGLYYLGVLLDHDAALLEVSETNNAASSNVTCNGQPDLEVVALTPLLPTWDRGAVVQVSATIENRGGVAAPAHTSDLRLGPDPRLGPGTITIGNQAVPALAPGQQHVMNLGVQIPASWPLGPCYVGAVADQGDVVAELDEGNNLRSRGVLCTQRFHGDGVNDIFGYAVSGAGDVNGDGFADVVVGAPNDDNNGVDSGSARVFSGLDGSVLYTFVGDNAVDWLGASVCDAGDVNGDGFADLVVGIPGDDNNGVDSGSARVFSGQDGAVLYTFNGDSAGDIFGMSVSGAGDVNGDGFADLVVGARCDDNNGSDSGSARVFSGQDGSVLYTFNGDSAGDGFGLSVSCAGDVNGDGLDDLVVGMPWDDNNGVQSGSVRVFSGRDGSVLYTFNGDSHDNWFGTCVRGVGDVNGDGFADLVVGAPYADANGVRSGYVRVFSGQDGSVLRTILGAGPSDYLGWSVDSPGDVDGDGFADILASYGTHGFGINRGRVQLFSGRDGTTLRRFDDDAYGDFGFSAAGAGDVDGDGFPDLVVGAFGDDANGTNTGSARVFSLRPLRAAVTHTLTGTPGAQLGRAVAGAGDVDLDGTLDVIAGAPLDNTGGLAAGRVVVASGADGSVLHTIVGNSSNDLLGFAVGDLGDVNRDGHADPLVGAPYDDGNGPNSGAASALLGLTGTLFTLPGDSTGDLYGSAVAGLGDVNGDGIPDAAIGAPGAAVQGLDSGSVQVRSGGDRAVLFTAHGNNAGDRLGEAVAAAGDVDDDGVGDVLVGAPGGGAGYARLLSGADGSVLRTFVGDTVQDRFGTSVAGGADVDGDGTPDVAVGAPGTFPATHGGYVRVFSGATGSTLFTFRGLQAGDALGSAVALADVDADGFADVVAGAPSAPLFAPIAGYVLAFSGRDGAVLLRRDGAEVGGRYGAAVACGGDIDGDGFADLVVGAPRAQAAAGRVEIAHNMLATEPGTFRPFGRGCAGVGAPLPLIGAIGRPRVGDTLAVTLRAGGPTSIGLLLIGGAPIAAPVLGCTLYTAPLMTLLQFTDAAGFASLGLAVPAGPTFLGVELTMQWGVLTAGGAVQASDAAAVRFGHPR